MRQNFMRQDRKNFEKNSPEKNNTNNNTNNNTIKDQKLALTESQVREKLRQDKLRQELIKKEKMQRCYFNSCIFNDNQYLSKFKSKLNITEDSPSLFVDIDSSNFLIKYLEIDSSLKKYIFCKFHYNNLLELKSIKESIIKNNNVITKECLIKLNKILKNNIDIKKCLDNLYFNSETKITPLLLKNLMVTKDRDTKLYLLMVLNHLLKEYFIVNRYTNNEVYKTLCNDLINQNLIIFDFNSGKGNYKLSEDELFREGLIFDLLLNNIECLFNNCKNSSQLDLDMTVKVVKFVMNVFSQIVTAHHSILDKKLCFEIFYNIIGFVNVYLSSKTRNIDLVIYVINFWFKVNEDIYGFLNEYEGQLGVDSCVKNYVITLETILKSTLGIKLTELNQDELEKFLKNTEEFNKDKKRYPNYYENTSRIEEIKDKINKLKEN